MVGIGSAILAGEKLCVEKDNRQNTGDCVPTMERPYPASCWSLGCFMGKKKKPNLFFFLYVIIIFVFVMSARPVSQFTKCLNSVPGNVVFHFWVFKGILTASNCLTYAIYSGQCLKHSKFMTNEAMITIIYHR